MAYSYRIQIRKNPGRQRHTRKEKKKAPSEVLAYVSPAQELTPPGRRLSYAGLVVYKLQLALLVHKLQLALLVYAMRVLHLLGAWDGSLQFYKLPGLQMISGSDRYDVQALPEA